MSVVVIIAVVAVVALLLFGVSRVTAAIPQLKGAGFERGESGMRVWEGRGMMA